MFRRNQDLEPDRPIVRFDAFDLRNIAKALDGLKKVNADTNLKFADGVLAGYTCFGPDGDESAVLPVREVDGKYVIEWNR